MFLGEMLCLIGLFIERHRSRHRRREAASRIALNSDAPAEDDGKDGAKHVFSWLFILPTLCDLGATSLAGIGLLYVPAVRFSHLIFPAITKIFITYSSLTNLFTLRLLGKCYVEPLLYSVESCPFCS